MTSHNAFASTQPPIFTPIVHACPTTHPTVLRQYANAFARPRGFSTAEDHQTSVPALLCHLISCPQAFQSLLWSARVMRAFSMALVCDGVVIVTHRGNELSVSNWFPPDSVQAVLYNRNLPEGESALLLRAHPNLAKQDSVSGVQTALLNDFLSRRCIAALRCLCKADFVSAENEHFVHDRYYLNKIKAWSAAGHATVLECHTGVEYFSLFRPGVCVLISVGVYAATDRPCTTFFDFVYAGAPLQYTCGHDMLGLADAEGQDVLRNMLRDVVSLLGGPSMALIYAVSSNSIAGFRYVKVELCRAEYSRRGTLGDLSWICRSVAAYEAVPIADENVVAEAMRAVHYEDLANDVEQLLRGNDVPVRLLLKYDVASAVRAIPHRRAMNRLRYAALLSRRTMLVPTAANARYDKVRATSAIHAIDAEGRVVGRKWLALALIVVASACGAAVAAYCISRDENVNSAEIIGTALAVGTVLLITLPQLHVETIGAGYTIGDLYRGCMPMTVVMQRRDVAFLKECVRKGANVEGVISGRHGCFLLGRGRGNLDIGPVKVRDLDDRWDYGVSDRGVLCLRYRGLVGDMQVRERKIDGKMCRWWHCAVVGSKIVKGVGKAEVLEYLGDGEIG